MVAWLEATAGGNGKHKPAELGGEPRRRPARVAPVMQDRNRLAPLTDGVEDDQAVYVGTQVRF